MKTMKKLYSFSSLILVLISLFLSQKSSAQLMSFDNPVLINGVNNEVGGTYRFQNVQLGIDAIVTVDSIVNGAVLKDIDKNGWGYTQAFQPFIQPPNGVNTSAYVVFTMKFVTSSTFITAVVPVFSLTTLDIDGDNFIKEFDIVDMNGGTATYNSFPSEISVTGIGTGFKGINVAGNEHGGPDTTQKSDIFTVKKINVSQLTIKAGTQGITTNNAARKYSFFPGVITYPKISISLPVSLVSFSAMLNNNSNKVDLKWVTASEMNASHFVVERSTDGKNFNDAGTVFASGNTNEKMDYSFSDNVSASQTGVIYYRLCSVDIDGKFEYSATRIIRIGKQAENAITILTYPNPVTSELRVTIPNNWQGKKVIYEIVNANGQVSGKSQVGNSSQTETLSVSTLSPGIYMVKASCGDQSAQQKIIKQ
jgi:Secretion system C-terminal sorting domain